MGHATKAYYDIRYKAIREVLDEYGDLPTRTLARMLNNRYPQMFPTVETGRRLLRYRQGTSGNKARKELKDKRYVKKKI